MKKLIGLLLVAAAVGGALWYRFQDEILNEEETPADPNAPTGLYADQEGAGE